MLNRSALVIRAKKPFIDWVNSLPGSVDIDRDYIDEDNTVYLGPDLIAGDDEQEKNVLIQSLYQHIFEEQLNDWITDESRWPSNRGLETFKEWFKVEFHSVVSDLISGPLEDDEKEDEEE